MSGVFCFVTVSLSYCISLLSASVCTRTCSRWKSARPSAGRRRGSSSRNTPFPPSRLSCVRCGYVRYSQGPTVTPMCCCTFPKNQEILYPFPVVFARNLAEGVSPYRAPKSPYSECNGFCPPKRVSVVKALNPTTRTVRWWHCIIDTFHSSYNSDPSAYASRKYRHCSGNRHYYAYCQYWCFPFAPNNFTGTI